MSELKRFYCEMPEPYPSDMQCMYQCSDGDYATYTDWKAEHEARLAAEAERDKLRVAVQMAVEETPDEYCQDYAEGHRETVQALIDERNALRAQLAAEREQAKKPVDTLKYASICLGPGGSDLIDEVLAAYQSTENNNGI